MTERATPLAGGLEQALADLAITACSVPRCGRTAVGVVEQDDGTLFAACEHHAQKAAKLAFRVIRADGVPIPEHELTASALAVGDPAPRLRLPRLEDGRPVADVRVSPPVDGRPVALAFGAASVAKFRKQLGGLEEVYVRHRDRVSFFVVYSQEVALGAAGSAGRQLSLAERATLAQALVEDFGVTIPVVLDRVDNGATRAFAAFPLRFYLIDARGRIAYQGGRGPYAFQPAELEAAVAEELARATAGPRDGRSPS